MLTSASTFAALPLTFAALPLTFAALPTFQKSV
jgi:hypothetical protein